MTQIQLRRIADLPSVCGRRSRRRESQPAESWRSLEPTVCSSEREAAGAITTFTGTVDTINIVLDGLTYTPDPNYAGDATICPELDRPAGRLDRSSGASLCVTNVAAVWRDGTSEQRLAVSIPITVTPVNDGPAIALIPDQRVVMDAPAQGIPLTVEDSDTPQVRSHSA